MQDARKILALVSAPQDVLNLSMLEEFSGFVHDKAPKAVVRIGDYPRRNREISVTVAVSQLTKVARLESLFLKAEALFQKREEINKETEREIKQMREFSSNLPTLD